MEEQIDPNDKVTGSNPVSNTTLSYSSNGQDTRLSILKQGFNSPIGYHIIKNISLM